MNNLETKSKIKSFLSTKFDINDNGIDSACSKFGDIVISVAKKSFGMKTLSRNKQNKSKKWYDEQLYLKRRELNIKASYMFKNPFVRSIRDSYFKCYRQYRKLVKYKKKKIPKQLSHS